MITSDPRLMCDLIESEHEAFHVTLALQCEGCSWRPIVQGFVFAMIAAQAHQELHALLAPTVPGIALGTGDDAWLLPPWRCSP